MHAPPYGTNLDIISPGFGPDTGERRHVGSMAIRQFIMEKQPYLCLHGHIHETVRLSGEFRDTIGSTLCMSAGNDNYTATLAVLVFDIYDIAGAKRLEL